MAFPKFYLEPRKKNNSTQAINMFYSFYGQRLQYYTGVRIDPKFYKATDAKGKPNDRGDVNKIISENAPYATIIKNNLKQIAIDAQNIANTAKANKIPVTDKYLKAELDKIHKHEEVKNVTEHLDFITYYEKFISECKVGIRVMLKGKNVGQNYSHNAIKNYGSSLSACKRFMKSNNIKKLNFLDINKEFYEKFRIFCFSVENKHPSTFAGFIKDIKVIMNHAGEDEIHTGDGHKTQSFVVPSYEADTIFLNEEQIDAIAELDLSDNSKYVTHLVPARDKFKKNVFDRKGNKVLVKEKISYKVLEKARDMSLIGFYTALRFGNFSNLSVKSIDDNFIKVNQIKGGGYISIPILNKLRPVISKYPHQLPTLSLQKFNKYIKLVAELAGLTQLVETKSFKGNIEQTVTYRICDLISSHTCRRSYATNMFKRGIPTMLIMSATGHKTETKFLLYIRATNEDKANLMAEALKKIGL